MHFDDGPVYISPEQGPDVRSATVWERIEEQTDVDEVLQSRAAFELKRRLQHWNGDYLPRPTRFKSKNFVSRGDHLVVPADPVELVIVRAVAMTRGAGQFGVSPNGAIFTAEGDGWTIGGPRVDVTRLSWLLDEAADMLHSITRGKGGRFYESGGYFIRAKDRSILMEVVDETEPATRADMAISTQVSRSWWQRTIDSIFGSDEPERAGLRKERPGPILPEEFLLARQAPLRRRAEASRQPQPTSQVWTRRPTRPAGTARTQICPIHFTEIPTSGSCDACLTS